MAANSPEKSPSIENILTALARDSAKKIHVHGLRGAASAFLIGRIADTLQRPLVIFVPSETDTSSIELDLALFTSIPVLAYPAYDIPPYTPLSPDPPTMANRLAALYRLVTMTAPHIVLVPAEALLRRTLPKNFFSSIVDYLVRDEETDQQQLVRKLISLGYQPVSLVQNVGEYSIRGGIIDIFASGFEFPVRLDFFGDTLESIRHFDPISQRSVDDLDECILLPTRDILLPAHDLSAMKKVTSRFRQRAQDSGWQEHKSGKIIDQLENFHLFPGVEFFLPLFYEKTSTFFDYLPSQACTIVLDVSATKASLKKNTAKIEANYREACDHGIPALPPAELFLQEEEFNVRLRELPSVVIDDFPPPVIGIDTACPNGNENSPIASACESFVIQSSSHQLIRQEIDLHRKTKGLLAPLADTMTGWVNDGDVIIMACRSDRHARHMADLLQQFHLDSSFLPGPLGHIPHNAPGNILLIDHPLSAGFDLPEFRLHLLSESELFGGRLKPGKKRRRKTEAPPISFDELSISDIVVHGDHGLGVFEGIVNLDHSGITNDFIVIRYQGEDKLYVPVDRLNAVTKYKGISDVSAKLDKLGGKSWENTKKKVKEAVWKVAQDLLELYARRKLTTGHAFIEPDELYQELEESFPFDETPGQLKAINEVLDDLCGSEPMDRLVCGDVGYGKTEVAVRAAFKVIEDNFQVAVLVPTTVLAEQHTETFKERLHGFPVRIETLSRFRTAAEQKEIVEGLATGKVDLVIGTHRLLSKDVIFKRLGLLIIDEEHRFGVKHKERLKSLKTNIDILTLTATPIPRTLQLSLLGIRDLSVISTPPALRRSVKTFIAEYDDMIVREAINRELYRGGQSFVVHNRVSSIDEMARKIQKLVPEVRIAVAHGQMSPKLLEEIMVKFVRKEIDVLVCTTIIESGLDIPNANTIVITRAERFGLADIYQLRGRVGRSSEQAYAYLLMPSLDSLPKEAQQRLRALMDYNELGGGFKLAMSDLQIRGGGNILGVSQSGNIAAVGYDLYLDLLQKTIEDMRVSGEQDTSKRQEEIDPEINLRISAFIPVKYINDSNQRYVAYRKLTSVNAVDDLMDLQKEFRDRYGPLPEETENLFAVIELKLHLKAQRITKLEQGPGNLVFTFQNITPINPQKILLFLKDTKNKARITPESRLIVHSSTTSASETILAVKKILQAIT